GCADAGEPRQERNPRPRRACVRIAAERRGWPDRAHDRHRASARQDRLAELGLQHSPLRDAGPDRRGMRAESARSAPRARRADKRKPHRRQIMPEIGLDPRTVAQHARIGGILRGALIGIDLAGNPSLGIQRTVGSNISSIAIPSRNRRAAICFGLSCNVVLPLRFPRSKLDIVLGGVPWNFAATLLPRLLSLYWSLRLLPH